MRFEVQTCGGLANQVLCKCCVFKAPSIKPAIATATLLSEKSQEKQTVTQGPPFFAIQPCWVKPSLCKKEEQRRHDPDLIPFMSILEQMGHTIM